jgi:hypothetical protein
VELDRIVKANRINLAMLAALPTFGLSLLLLSPVRALAVHVCICTSVIIFLIAISTPGHPAKVIVVFWSL